MPDKEKKKERKDPKGRTLLKGESCSYKRGRLVYRFKETIDHKTIEFTSYTLTAKDRIPKGVHQQKGESLREKKAEYDISKQNAIDHKGGGMTVLELMQKFATIRSKDVRETTRKGYQTQLNLMQENKTAILMASKRIRDVNPVDAEEWMMLWV